MPDVLDLPNLTSLHRPPGRPLFVSFEGNKGQGGPCGGFVVMDYNEPIDTGGAVMKLCRHIERLRGYDPNSIVILNFRRMETADG